MGVTFKGPPCSVSSISWVPSPKGSRASPKRLLPAGEQAIKTWAHGNISELNYNSLMWWSLAFPICTSQSEKFFAFTTWEMRFITLERLTAGPASPVLQPPCQWKRCNENPRGYMEWNHRHLLITQGWSRDLHFWTAEKKVSFKRRHTFPSFLLDYSSQPWQRSDFPQ